MAVIETKVSGYNSANLGYLSKVYLIRVREVLRVVDSWRNKLVGAAGRTVRNGDILLKSSAVCYQLVFPFRVAQMRVLERGSASLLSYECSIMGDVPGVQLDVLLLDDENRQDEWVVLAIENNGRGWVLGNEERGLSMRVNHTVGADNVLMVEFSGITNVPPTVLESVDLGSIFPDAAFSVEFSRDFLA